MNATDILIFLVGIAMGALIMRAWLEIRTLKAVREVESLGQTLREAVAEIKAAK